MDAKRIAFVSGKGGTGKSTTSVFVGGALAKLGRRVLLVELDCGLRSVDIIAGISGDTVYDIRDVLTGVCEPEKAMVESPFNKGLYIISAPYAGGEITAEGIEALCTRLAPGFDYILLDTAAGFGEPYAAAVAAAQMMVLVLTPDPVALRDGRLMADDLAARGVQMRLVLNRVNREHILRDKVLADLDEAIDLVGVQLLGVVPDSGAILKAGALGDPLPKNSTEQAVYNAIAGRLDGQRVPLVYE